MKSQLSSPFQIPHPSRSAQQSRRTPGLKVERSLQAAARFDPVTLGGKTFVPRQGNNVYIFPGVGLGVIACRAKILPDDMFLAAAKALAGVVTEDDLKQGGVYPPISKIREASAQIAIAVVKMAYERGLAARPKPYDIEQYVRSFMWYPEYEKLCLISELR